MKMQVRMANGEWQPAPQKDKSLQLQKVYEF